MEKSKFVSDEIDKLFREKVFDAPFIPTISYLIKLLQKRDIYLGVKKDVLYEYVVKKRNLLTGGSGYNSFDDAINAGLKYCLTNLL